MLERWFGPKAHYFLHVLGFAVLAIGLPFNKVLMSIGAIWGASNVVLMGNYSTSLNRLKNNRLFIAAFALFAIHLVGLLWSHDLGYGLDDIRKKLPLLAVPLAVAAGPRLQRQHTDLLLQIFVLAVWVASVAHFISFLKSGASSTDFRAYSLFVSHIRFSLMVVAALFICLYFIRKKPTIQWLGIVCLLWLLLYLFYSQVISGFLALAGGVYFIAIYNIWPKKVIRIAVLTAPFILFLAGFFWMNSVRNNINFKETVVPLSQTKSGDYYHHDWNNSSRENGNLIYRNIYDPELDQEWPKRSDMSLEHSFENGAFLRDNLYRYMTSLGLTKDSVGLAQLDARDIQNIEQGFTSALNAKPGILGRIASLRFQLENNHDPNSSTLFQRLEYWNAGWKIYVRSPIIGVGTGDVQAAFNIHYTNNNSVLSEDNRRRAHNTYLTALITWGPIGLILILCFFLRFMSENRQHNNWLAFAFAGLLGFSFFNEDTLETQAGVSLFVFLISFYLNPQEEAEGAEDN